LPISHFVQEKYVPLATTEGGLIASINRDAKVAGHISVQVRDRGMTRAPIISCNDINEAFMLVDYVNCNFETLAEKFNSTTRYGKLLKIEPHLHGNDVFLRCQATTGDAMGMNMVTKGCQEVILHLLEQFPDARFLAMSGNVCSDKKANVINMINGRGKLAVAECFISNETLNRLLKVDAKSLIEVHTKKNLYGSALAATIGGQNCHVANIVGAIYAATGQDLAQIGTSSTAFLGITEIEEGVKMTLTMPCIEIATVGGGTAISCQKGGLKMADVESSMDLAAVVCATALCGEISLLTAITNHQLLSNHMKLNRK
jgi:hydroxymethylglutaryl-CoA reductase (NADPH)